MTAVTQILRGVSVVLGLVLVYIWAAQGEALIATLWAAFAVANIFTLVVVATTPKGTKS